MAKTRRDLLMAIAEKIGGERGKRMREALETCQFSSMMERTISDQEYESLLAHAERDLPGLLHTFEHEPHRKAPGTWGFPN